MSGLGIPSDYSGTCFRVIMLWVFFSQFPHLLLPSYSSQDKEYISEKAGGVSGTTTDRQSGQPDPSLSSGRGRKLLAVFEILGLRNLREMTGNNGESLRMLLAQGDHAAKPFPETSSPCHRDV